VSERVLLHSANPTSVPESVQKARITELDRLSECWQVTTYFLLYDEIYPKLQCSNLGLQRFVKKHGQTIDTLLLLSVEQDTLATTNFLESRNGSLEPFSLIAKFFHALNAANCSLLASP